MSGERREHHLHNAASLDPVSAEDPQMQPSGPIKYAAKRIRKPSRNFTSKQLLSFDRETVVKVNLLFGMQIQKSGQSEDA